MRGRMGEGVGGERNGGMGGTRRRIREGWEDDGKKAWRKHKERREESKRTWGRKTERGVGGGVGGWANTKVGEHSLFNHRTSPTQTGAVARCNSSGLAQLTRSLFY